jgi:hypothetical protein
MLHATDEGNISKEYKTKGSHSVSHRKSIGTEENHNKKFWEELIIYFPLI